MAIQYTQGYINSIINRGREKVGILAYNHAVERAFGLSGNTYFNLYMELRLYIEALCDYVIDSENNCITDEQKDFIIERIINITGCSDCIPKECPDGILSDRCYGQLLDDFGYSISI